MTTLLSLVLGIGAWITVGTLLVLACLASRRDEPPPRLVWRVILLWPIVLWYAVRMRGRR